MPLFEPSAASRRPAAAPTAGPASVPAVLASVLGGLGRILVTIGVLLLLFGAFQLWGTGVAEARAQEALEDRFVERLAMRTAPGPSPPPAIGAVASPRTTSAAARVGRSAQPGYLATVALVADTLSAIRPRSVAPGDPIGVLDIPAIGVHKTIVEGTSRDVLRSGPGHYGSTPLPGRRGNAAIAGHRTTHGAPFLDIDRLQPGDEINVETLDGTFTYVVEGHPDGDGDQVGHLIVDPSEVGVIADKGDDRLTLTACHPKYSAEQRIIVTAVMHGRPLAAADPAPEPASLAFAAADDRPGEPSRAPSTPETGRRLPAADEQAEGAMVAESLGWQADMALPTLLLALATAAIATAGWALGRFWRRLPAYAIALPPFGLALFHCFVALEKFIPAV